MDPVCPLDYRYGRAAMRAVFGADAYLQRLLAVEAALAEAQAAEGLIPVAHAEAIRAALPRVTRERVEAIEAEIRHDLMAVVKALAEQAGEGGASVHLGATSYDIIDTTRALQHREAVVLLKDGLTVLQAALAVQARVHRDTVMLGRTHGQWATPITFGLKMANYALEVQRHQQRLAEIRPRLFIGKLLGAVGTGAAMAPHTLAVQARMMEALDLAAPVATTQIIGRDRVAELVLWGANLATSLEKFTTEVRNLQRSEIAEAAEAFDTAKQVGSSTMAHKRNPITCENVAGLARVVRSLVHPALENNLQWHERDLANSSCERFVIPHCYLLLDELLHKSAEIFRHLFIDPARMRRNLAEARGLPLAEAVMMALASQGMDRQAAHEVVRRAAMAATAGELPLKEALLREAEVTARLDEAALDRALDPANYLGHAGEIVDRALAELKP